MIKIIEQSHVDHGLERDELERLLGTLWLSIDSDAEPGVLVRTLRGAEPRWCDLRGPIVGDDPIGEDDVEYVIRHPRSYPSRMATQLGRVRDWRVTLVVGPHGDEPWVLYTAYPGPAAPREPGDPSLEGAALEESRAFWAEHALVPR